MAGGYASVKKWRAKRKNKSYMKLWMQERRAEFRKLYLKRKIAYEDIPKSYRYYADSLNRSA